MKARYKTMNSNKEYGFHEYYCRFCNKLFKGNFANMADDMIHHIEDKHYRQAIPIITKGGLGLYYRYFKENIERV